MITGLFNLLALIYAFRSLQIARIVWRDWGDLQGESFTPQQKGLAGQASFFLSVPVAVFFHELAHAVAVWLFGGQVVRFGYRFFWGFVEWTGEVTAAQAWFISLAGTLGSLAFGLALWLVLRKHPSPSVRYFALRSFRYQIFFSIIYYPLFTLLGFYGDWRTIYDFDSTPVLSGLTAVLHVAALGLFFWADRRGWFEMASFQSAVQRQRFAELETVAAANPQDPQAQLQLIRAYRLGGMTNMARQQVRDFLKNHPNSAEGHMELAAVQAAGKGQVPASARKSAAEALSLGLSNPADVAYANQLMGQYSLGVGKLDEAIGHFNQGIAAARKAGQPMTTAHLNYLRGVAHRRQEHYQAAYQDVQEAIRLARGSGQGGAVSHYESELLTIESHAGRPLGPAPKENSLPE